MPQLAAVPENRQRLSEGERLRIESADARRHLPDDPLSARGELSIRELPRRGGPELERTHQFAKVEGVAAADPPQGGAQLVARLATERCTGDIGDGGVAQEPGSRHR